MADIPTPEQEPALTDDDALRQRLLSRIAVAAVVIIGLLGSLAMFDALYSPAPPAKVAAVTPPPVATPAVAPAPVAAEPAKEPVAEEKPAADAEKPAAPVADAGPATTAKAEPEQTKSPGAPPLVPLPPEKPLTKPATSRQAAIRPPEPIVPPTAVRPDPQREIARAPVAPGSPTVPARSIASSGGNQGAPASRPITQAVQSAQRQFALQLGVFNNIANAEDMRAKLELHGIPSTIEARVQVGPFNTRAEVEAARDKLRALGMESGLMVSLRK